MSLNGKALTCEQIVELVLLSINAHYQRDADKVERMLTELKKLDQQEMVEIFKGLREGTPFEEAVPLLTNWVEAKIDGTVI
jgi:Zn finger protein HypA/HybF involved in hydrogenase expression